MFWKKDRDEVENLRRENAKAGRDREAARLNFVRSLDQVRRHLNVPPIDIDLARLGADLTAPREKD